MTLQNKKTVYTLKTDQRAWQNVEILQRRDF